MTCTRLSQTEHRILVKVLSGTTLYWLVVTDVAVELASVFKSSLFLDSWYTGLDIVYTMHIVCYIEHNNQLRAIFLRFTLYQYCYAFRRWFTIFREHRLLFTNILLWQVVTQLVFIALTLFSRWHNCQCYEHQLCHNLWQWYVSKQQSVLPENDELIPRKSVGVLVKFKSQKSAQIWLMYSVWYPEYWDSRFLRNVGNYLLINTTLRVCVTVSSWLLYTEWGIFCRHGAWKVT